MRTVVSLLALSLTIPISAPRADTNVVTVATALASDEFDEDGRPDLVCAYADGDGGLLALYTRDGDRFTRDARVTRVPVAPDAIATGDFDNDGHRDVAVAAIGGRALVLMPGDGRGRFGAPRALELPGRVTALASGDVNRADGLADLVVAVDGAAGPRLLVFEGPDGAFGAAPETVDLGTPATAIATGHVVGRTLGDIVVAAGGDLMIIEGRDRHLVAGPAGAITTPPRVTVAASPLAVMPIAAGAPVATLAMRLNGDAVDDLVVLRRGASEPTVLLSSPRQTFVVTTTADSGRGSLREAILGANANAGADEIDFRIGQGAQQIALASPLPEITDPVTIDATTQPGFAGKPLVTVLGSESVRDGLVISAGSSVVRGLALNRFRADENFDLGRAILLETNGGNRIEGNRLGTEVRGDGSDGDGNDFGMFLELSDGNAIGGPTPEQRNVFTGNVEFAIFADQSGDNVLQNNLFGVTADMVEVPNITGVRINNGPNNLLGGTLPGEGNLMLENFNYGFDILSLDSAGNRVQGNWVGIDPTGTVTGFNHFGVGICTAATPQEGARDNIVGGTAAGAANVIANNDVGVAIGTAPDVEAIRNQVLCNRIFANTMIGIDLADDVFSLDDPGDLDGGPNFQQNAPLLSSLRMEGDTAVVSGTLDSTPNTAFRVEIFSGAGRSAFGFGDGGALVAVANVRTDASGTATIEVSVPAASLQGPSLVATATDGAGNTSEFSLSIALSLSWDEPDPNGGPNAPPRNPAVRIPNDDDPRPPAPAARGGAFQGYNVYRSNRPDFQVGPESLFQSMVPQQVVSTFAFPSGSFFRITAVYTTGESAPTPVIGGGVPPTLRSARLKGSKLVVDGEGFTSSVLTLLDGIPFVRASKVKKAGTRVVQPGPLVGPIDIGDFIAGNTGVSTLMVRNADGGTSLRRVTR